MEFNETKTKKEFNMEEIPCLSKSKSAVSILKSKTSVENTSIDEENNSSSDESADNINNKYKRMKSFDEKFEKEIAKNYDLENKLKHSITNAQMNSVLSSPKKTRKEHLKNQKIISIKKNIYY